MLLHSQWEVSILIKLGQNNCPHTRQSSSGSPGVTVQAASLVCCSNLEPVSGSTLSPVKLTDDFWLATSKPEEEGKKKRLQRHLTLCLFCPVGVIGTDFIGLFDCYWSNISFLCTHYGVIMIVEGFFGGGGHKKAWERWAERWKVRNDWHVPWGALIVSQREVGLVEVLMCACACALSWSTAALFLGTLSTHFLEKSQHESNSWFGLNLLYCFTATDG